MVLYLTLISTV